MAINLQVQDGSNITVDFNSGPLDGGLPGGNVNTLQYNDNGVFGGVPTATYANGVLTLGPNSALNITGGTPGQVLTQTGTGLSWTTPASANTVETTGSGLGFSLSNTQIGSTTTVQFNTPTDLQLRSTLNIGNVANLEFATLNPTQNWLRGDGVWANIPNPTFVENSNIANVAYSVSGANVVGPVANATFAQGANTAVQAYNVDGANVNGQVANAAYADSADTAILAFAVDGANVIGPVNNAFNATNATFATTAGSSNYAPYAGNVTLPNQPNITQVGTLLNLAVSGTSNLSNVSNVKIGGGIPGQVLVTDGAGNLTWATMGLGGNGIVSQPAIEFIAPTTANNQQFVAGNLTAFADATFAELYLNGVLQPASIYTITGNTLQINRVVNTGERITIGPVSSAAAANSVPFANVANTANTATNANYSNFSGEAFLVSGGNVAGKVGSAVVADFATVANSVAGSNVTGIVANANYAAFAGEAYLVAGANVVGAVPVATLATLATTAQSVPGANITGVVANANYSSFSNVATVANSVQAAGVIGTVNSANFATFSQTLTGNAQPNVTSVGTLTNLSVSGVSNLFGGTITPNVTGTTTGLTLNSGGVLQNITLNATSNVIDASNNFITNLRDPQQPQDAATKNYVDATAQGLFVKQSVNCATTAPLPSDTTYINGTLGVGATLVFSIANAPVTLDGYPLQNGDRILVKDQVDPVQNGIYVRTTQTTWTRSDDGNIPDELEYGDFLLVVNGIQNAGSGWIQTTNVTTIGTDPVLYNQFSAAGSYTAGAGLQLIGTQFSMLDTTVVPGAYGNATHVGTFNVNSRGQITAATNTPITPYANSLVGNTLSSNVLFSNLTTVGTLANLQVTGAVTVGGNITAGNVTAVTLDGRLSDGNQPNIYQVGALANLQVIGEANLGYAANLVLMGGGANDILTSIDANGNVQWSNTLNLAGANIGNLRVTNSANLGPVGNITISGGLNGQVLTSYGNGSVYWSNGTGGNTSNTAFQPAIEFIAPVDGALQSFTHPNIATFANREFTSVYVNGSLQRQGDYTISGNTLTFSRYLKANAEITVGSTATTVFTGGTVKSITAGVIDPDSIGFNLTTTPDPITENGTVTLTVPSAAQIGAAIANRAYMYACGGSMAAASPLYTPFVFNNVLINRGITYNNTTGLISLQANVDYRLSATMRATNVGGGGSGNISFMWLYANNQPIYPIFGPSPNVDDPGGAEAQAIYVNAATDIDTTTTNEIAFRPTANCQVKLASLSNGTNGFMTDINFRSLIVQQI